MRIATVLAAFGAAAVATADDATGLDLSQVRLLLSNTCADCHYEAMEGGPKGGFTVDDLTDALDPRDDHQFAKLVQVHDRIASGEMPPPEDGYDPVDPAAATVLSDALVAADQERIAADGRTRRRRLTRTEYEQAVHDLLQIDTPLASRLPGDAVAHGFDKTTDALGLSSVLMQKYLEAARVAVDAAVQMGDRPETTVTRYDLISESQRKDGKQLKTAPLFFPIETDDDRRAMLVIANGRYCPSDLRSMRTPVAGTYRITVSAYAYRHDGKATEPIAYQLFGGPLFRKKGASQLLGFFEAQPYGEGEPTTVTADLPADATVKVVPWDTGYRIYQEKAANSTETGLALQWIEVEGPIVEQWPPASQQIIFGDLPIETVGNPKWGKRAVRSGDPQVDATRLLTRFAQRAFRRKVSEADVQPFVGLVMDKLEAGATFTEALPIGYQAILCDPLFLTIGCDAGQPDLSQAALASRLSFFLWGSLPDQELRDLAAAGNLSDSSTLRAQAGRLLDDPRSDRFIRDLANQWLDLAWLDAATPDPELFPEYDDLLRDSMERETLATLDYMIRENRPAREIADADWAFLNERLAIHYGLEELGVEGVELRRVTLPPESIRGGFLTQASTAKVTANGTHTTPVYRGVWVLDAILGQPVPPPPPGIPAVEPDVRGAKTIRELLAVHQSNGDCAACHKKMDPAGFALEALDVIGTERAYYRTPPGKDAKRQTAQVGNRQIKWFENPDNAVDSSGRLPDGREFADLREFKRLIAETDRQLAISFAEKMVVYGTGEGVQFCDREAIEAIVDRTEADGYGLRSLLLEVVASDLFRRR